MSAYYQLLVYASSRIIPHLFVCEKCLTKRTVMQLDLENGSLFDAAAEGL